MVTPIVTAATAEALGRAFTETLMMIAERDLPNMAKVGAHLLSELRARGLTVIAIRPQNTQPDLRIAP